MECSSRKGGPPDWTSRGPRWHFHSTSHLCFSLSIFFICCLSEDHISCLLGLHRGTRGYSSCQRERRLALHLLTFPGWGTSWSPLGLVVQLTGWGPGAAYCTNGSQELALWMWFVIGKGNVLNKAIWWVCTPLGIRSAVIHLLPPPGVSIFPRVLEETLFAVKANA